jgi:hypothetical protein
MTDNRITKLYNYLKDRLSDQEKEMFREIMNDDSEDKKEVELKPFDPISSGGSSPDYPRFYANNLQDSTPVFEDGNPFDAYKDDNHVNQYRGLNNFTNSFTTN